MNHCAVTVTHQTVLKDLKDLGRTSSKPGASVLAKFFLGSGSWNNYGGKDQPAHFQIITVPERRTRNPITKVIKGVTPQPDKTFSWDATTATSDPHTQSACLPAGATQLGPLTVAECGAFQLGLGLNLRDSVWRRTISRDLKSIFCFYNFLL